MTPTAPTPPTATGPWTRTTGPTRTTAPSTRTTGPTRTASPTGDHAPAEAGAAVAEPGAADTERSASDRAEEPTEERYDTTPTRDWAADEGDLLAENRDRGDRLADDRDDLRTEDDRLAGVAAREGASAPETDATSASGSRATASDVADDESSTERDDSVDQAVGRRVSEFDELRDGGYGVGSAAPLDDGAQPLDHPVQGTGTR